MKLFSQKPIEAKQPPYVLAGWYERHLEERRKRGKKKPAKFELRERFL